MNNAPTTVRSGWVTYAGVLLTIGGVGNLLWGISAVRDASDWGNLYPLADSTFVGPLEFWGWFAIVVAIVEFLAAWLVFSRNEAGRWGAIAIAALSIVFWLAVMPVFPLFAFTILVLDAFALYGLSVHWDGDQI